MGVWENLKNKLMAESEEMDILESIPLEKESHGLDRQSYMQEQFSFAVVMAGSGLGLGLSIKGVILATIIGLVILSWLEIPLMRI